jgi:hypothetical protein
MIKHFCDVCGVELGDFNKFPEKMAYKLALLKGAGGVELHVRLITSKNGVQHEGEFCKYCIIAAVNTADDRPRCA